MSDEPKTLLEWRAYLRNAAQVPKDSPDYQDAREAIAYALQRMHNLTVAANVADTPEQPGVSGKTALGVGLMQGLSLGVGEPIAGALSAVTGGSFREGTARYREGLENVQTQHPTITPAAELGGMVALPAGQIGGGLSAIKAGVPLTATQGAGMLTRGALAGAIPGAIAGFSAGGEDPGDIPARLTQGKKGAILGFILGGLSTGVGMRVARRHVERGADIRLKGTQRAIAESRLRAAQRAEATPPPDMHQAGGVLDDIGQAQADYAAGKISEDDFATAMEVAGQQMRKPVRATELPIEGEVSASAPPVEPIPGTQGRGFTAEGSPTPPVPTTPTILEMQRGRITEDPIAQQMARTGMGSPSKGRGVGGHSYSGTYPKGTPMPPNRTVVAPSPVGGPLRGLAAGQLQAIQEALANATPAEIPGLLESLKSMGILTEAQVAEVLASVAKP